MSTSLSRVIKKTYQGIITLKREWKESYIALWIQTFLILTLFVSWFSGLVVTNNAVRGNIIIILSECVRQ